MKNLTKRIGRLLILPVFLGLSLVACQQEESSKDEANTAEAAQEKETNTEATAENAIPTKRVINPNLATEYDLKSLGFSSELVEQILAQRPFLTMNAFDALLGEQENKEALYQKVFVPFNLNTTAEADFKLIPGVGDRMAHEFEEYRPYTSIQQFRKEIGKYVDEAEVARYENFVFVPVELNSASEADIKALPGVGDRMAHEFEEYRPYANLAQFRKEIGKYVDENELKRLERLVYLKESE